MGHSKDSAFIFSQELIKSIESFVNLEEQKDSSVFAYKGANLKYAYERYLYIKYVNDSRLYNLYNKSKEGKSPAMLVFWDLTEYKIARILLDEYSYLSFTLPADIIIIFKRLIKIPIFFLWNVLFNSFSNESKVKKVDLVIYAKNKRFVKYLTPIIENFPKSYIFLVRDKDTLNFIKQEKLPAIFSRLRLEFLFNIFKDQPLNDSFMSILYDTLFPCIKRINPKVLLVVEGNAPDDEIINQICKKLSIKSVCIQQGWSPIVHNGARNMSFSKMLVWGKGFGDLLKPYNRYQKFVATGNHNIGGTDRLSTKVKLISFFLQMPSSILSENDFYRFINLAVWTAKKFPDYEIYIREHPNFLIQDDLRKKLEKITNIRLDPDAKLGEMLHKSFLSVSIYSTTILESAAVGTLPLIVNLTSAPNFFPDLNKIGAGIEVKTIKEAEKVMVKLIKDKKFYNSFAAGLTKFRRRFFQQGDAVQKIVDNLS